MVCDRYVKAFYVNRKNELYLQIGAISVKEDEEFLLDNDAVRIIGRVSRPSPTGIYLKNWSIIGSGGN